MEHVRHMSQRVAFHDPSRREDGGEKEEGVIDVADRIRSTAWHSASRSTFTHRCCRYTRCCQSATPCMRSWCGVFGFGVVVTILGGENELDG